MNILLGIITVWQIVCTESGGVEEEKNFFPMFNLKGRRRRRWRLSPSCTQQQKY